MPGKTPGRVNTPDPTDGGDSQPGVSLPGPAAPSALAGPATTAAPPAALAASAACFGPRGTVSAGSADDGKGGWATSSSPSADVDPIAVAATAGVSRAIPVLTTTTAARVSVVEIHLC